MPTTLAQHIGRYSCQFDVRAFERLLQPIHFSGTLLHERRPIAGQSAKLALGSVGYEAALKQTMPQQIGNPLAIANISLSPWNLLDVMGIHQ